MDFKVFFSCFTSSQMKISNLKKKKRQKKVTFAAFRKQSTTTLTADIDALVGSVLAVGLSVTMPSLRHTLAVLTHKVWGRTSLCHCRRTKGETWSSVKVKTKPLCSFLFFSFNIQTTSLRKERREATREVRVVSHTSRKSQWALLSHCLLLEMYSCLSSAGAQSDGALISRRRCHAEDTKATKCHWASAREREREREGDEHWN